MMIVKDNETMIWRLGISSQHHHTITCQCTFMTIMFRPGTSSPASTTRVTPTLHSRPFTRLWGNEVSIMLLTLFISFAQARWSTRGRWQMLRVSASATLETWRQATWQPCSFTSRWQIGKPLATQGFHTFGNIWSHAFGNIWFSLGHGHTTYHSYFRRFWMRWAYQLQCHSGEAILFICFIEIWKYADRHCPSLISQWLELIREW